MYFKILNILMNILKEIRLVSSSCWAMELTMLSMSYFDQSLSCLALGIFMAYIKIKVKTIIIFYFNDRKYI